MSVDKVATALLLNAQIIEAIETDSFEHLPAPTFVRGYLRGYARVLGLPAGPVLEMYDRRGFEPPPLAPDVVESHQAHTSDVPVRLVTYAVAAVLAVLVGLWWNSQEDGGFGIGADLFDWSSDPAEDMSPGDVAEAGTAPADTGAEDESIATTPLPASEASQGEEAPVPPPAESEAPGDVAEARTAPADADAGVALTAAAEPAAETNSGATNREDTVVPGGTDRTESVDESAGAPPPAVTPPAVPATPSPETARTSPDTGAGPQTAQSGLVIEFVHESWVEVYDRERTRLFFGLVQPRPRTPFRRRPTLRHPAGIRQGRPDGDRRRGIRSHAVPQARSRPIQRRRRSRRRCRRRGVRRYHDARRRQRAGVDPRTAGSRPMNRQEIQARIPYLADIVAAWRTPALRHAPGRSGTSPIRTDEHYPGHPRDERHPPERDLGVATHRGPRPHPARRIRIRGNPAAHGGAHRALPALDRGGDGHRSRRRCTPSTIATARA